MKLGVKLLLWGEIGGELAFLEEATHGSRVFNGVPQFQMILGLFYIQVCFTPSFA